MIRPTDNVWKQIGSIAGYIIGLIGAVVSIATLKGTVELPFWVLLVIFYITLIMLVALIKVSHRLRKTSYKSGRVKAYEYNKNGSENGKDVLTTVPSNNLRVDTLVTIYYDLPGQRDKKLGYGRVTYETPGENNEIEILHLEEDKPQLQEAINGIKDNKRSHIKKCYVLPNFYYEEAETAYRIVGGIK